MTSQRLCVYVAGAYSADNVLGVLGNIRRGLDWSKQVWLEGHAPFCPWADHLTALQLSEAEAATLSVQDYYEASEAWLRKADVLFVTPGWEASKGTAAEIALASEKGIPVVYSMHGLRCLAKTFRNDPDA